MGLYAAPVEPYVEGRDYTKCAAIRPVARHDAAPRGSWLTFFAFCWLLY